MSTQFIHSPTKSLLFPLFFALSFFFSPLGRSCCSAFSQRPFLAFGHPCVSSPAWLAVSIFRATATALENSPLFCTRRRLRLGRRSHTDLSPLGVADSECLCSLQVSSPLLSRHHLGIRIAHPPHDMFFGDHGAIPQRWYREDVIVGWIWIEKGPCMTP